MSQLYEINPSRPLVTSIERVRDAMLIPVALHSARKRPHLGGVIRADGSFVQNSTSFIDENRSPTRTPPPMEIDDADYRSGKWLYGGRYDPRFGHFLVETIARLWALDHIGVAVEGVAFVQPFAEHKVEAPDRFIDGSRQLYDLFEELPHPALFVKPTRFETLFVPPQGCGAGQLAVGCPEFRKFVRLHFSKRQKPSGGRRLYLSRSRLMRSPGQITHEELIEDSMRGEGYEIFHPEEHSIDDQIARIRAAELIVGVEGSAFHLVAYAANPGCTIGVIRRRDNQNGILNHCDAFHGDFAVDLNCLASSFVVEGSKYRISNAVLDFSVLSEQLRRGGFVSKGFDLPHLSAEDIDSGIQELADRILGTKAT
jgi:hypothetical protein